jgi:putative oxidoreductase
LKGPFVGIVEIIRGMLIILGLFTGLAAMPLIIIMIVAIVSTKVPTCSGMTSGFICPNCRATVSGA